MEGCGQTISPKELEEAFLSKQFFMKGCLEAIPPKESEEETLLSKRLFYSKNERIWDSTYEMLSPVRDVSMLMISCPPGRIPFRS